MNNYDKKTMDTVFKMYMDYFYNTSTTNSRWSPGEYAVQVTPLQEGQQNTKYNIWAVCTLLIKWSHMMK